MTDQADDDIRLTRLIAELVDSTHVEQPNGLKMIICSRCNRILETDVPAYIWGFMTCPSCRPLSVGDSDTSGILFLG